MKMNADIAEKPEDLQKITFRQMKALVRKEFKRLRRYTSKDDPTDCILLGKHDYPDKRDMMLPVFGEWKWDFINYAKKEVVKDRLGAIGEVYYNGIEEGTNNMIICIDLEKGKGKDDIRILEKQFYKLVSKSEYTIILREVSSSAQKPADDRSREEQQQDKAKENPTPSEDPANDNGGVEKAAAAIHSNIKALIKRRSTDFGVGKELSLDVLKPLVRDSRLFWKELQEEPDEKRKALSEQVYASYGNLEKALYNHWVESADALAPHKEFIENVGKIFTREFDGKNNTAHDDYGTGKELRTLAKYHEVYKGVEAVEGEINKLFNKYKLDAAIKGGLDDLEQLSADVEALSQAEDQLSELIKKHYKNGRLRDDLFDALEDWEDTRMAITEQINPYLEKGYEAFKDTLIEAKTVGEITTASTRLSDSVTKVEGLLPQFMRMDRLRAQLEKIDKEDQLSEDSGAETEEKKQLLSFVKTTKAATSTWLEKEVKLLAESDGALTASNEALEAERKKLAEAGVKIRELKEKGGEMEWDAFWEANEAEQKKLESIVTEVDKVLEDNLKKRDALDQAFSSAYEQFTAIVG